MRLKEGGGVFEAVSVNIRESKHLRKSFQIHVSVNASRVYLRENAWPFGVLLGDKSPKQKQSAMLSCGASMQDSSGKFVNAVSTENLFLKKKSIFQPSLCL